MPALAMTDHGNLYGAFDFAGQAVKAGIKPIIGTEAYIAPGSRFDKRLPDGGSAKTDKYSHMTLWAADPAGYSNLIKLSSLASLEGYYYKPRMDRELLSRYAGGIIGTTGCPGGEVSQALERGDYELAKAHGGGVRRDLRPRQFLRRADAARHRHREAHLPAAGQDRQGARPPAGRHQRSALHQPGRQHGRTRCCCACRPARPSPTRRVSSSRPTSST